MTELVWRPTLSELETAQVRELLASDEAGIDLPAGGEHLLAVRDGVVGYAHVDTAGDQLGNQVAELVVHPDHRRQGVGEQLLTAVAERARPLRIWSHRDHPGAARLAGKLGFQRVRELHRMGMDFGAEEFAEPVLPDGVRLRAFVTGQDEQAVVAVNARAFSWHPEQGGLTVDDVRATEREDWFDPAGFFLAVDAQDEVVGFHWTKVHPDSTGEVYVVGVDPAAQGGGLGKALTLAGLRHLRGLGLPRVILYVESDNTVAIAVYRKLGFGLLDAGVQYAR
ncbi:mycothiol synthase [Kibdelosporangium phytohabitans]|uniref:Mycothiol acetyltransferase n=1 Tax=Kibdelosporangium phytohabitans TaxID=860235 RepID=A0A0N9IGZ8_9PSEU|nr:mycothiol acetyltransferase [Kibdelosporangium phytohabitans]MBE1466842.1 mycothiol synthase [Kibdelosporangium phytohabitans]